VLNLLGHDLRTELSGLQFQVPATPKKTPALDNFGLDLTKEAKQGRLATSHGRKEELDGIILVLSCLSHNNPILVGEPGVGKGAIIRGLAHFSAGDNWPASLNRRRLIALDFSYLAATGENDEQFKKGIRALMNELKESGDILLYLNDLQRFFQPPGTLVAEYLWSAFRSGLARGQIQCVGQATPQQYQTWIGSDVFLSRHFQPIFVAPLSKAQTLEILHFNRDVYESHYRVEITVEALEAAVELCEYHFKDRCLPGKAVHLLEIACALVRLHQTATPPDLKELDAEMDQINKEKEGAVAEQDFARAAHLRDQADQLKKRRSEIEAEWNKEAFTKMGMVDKEAVEKAVTRMGGSQLP